ncbi:PH domain-containing protein [Propionicicella superfundia]|uniref:PH domain-containing protein n=1 Tax=Propionicicella superfundia TaxID=348582 RepID=UPI0004182476|nr:PH domain-containing protein [Propionicicella superfundia]
MAGVLRQFVAPDVERRLLVSEGEVVIDEVRKHWVVNALPVCVICVGAAFFVFIPFAGALFWVPLLAGLSLWVYGMIRIHQEFMDRFVITNMRVFRVNGILSQHLATMPIARILDISVDRPLVGRFLGYGHFVFESAAQDQGLRVIRFVGDPEERDLTIQRVIQRSGIRARMPVDPDSGDGI